MLPETTISTAVHTKTFTMSHFKQNRDDVFSNSSNFQQRPSSQCQCNPLIREISLGHFRSPILSPGLAPNDFHLFPEFKTQLEGQRSQTNKESQDSIKIRLKLPATFYDEEVGKLVHKCNKFDSQTLLYIRHIFQKKYKKTERKILVWNRSAFTEKR